MPQVWQTFSSPEELKKTVSEAIKPEDRRDVLWNTLLWQEDTEDLQQDFQTVIVDEQERDGRNFADLLVEMFPFVKNMADEIDKDVALADDEFRRYQTPRMYRKLREENKKLFEMEAFFKSLEGISKTDAEIAVAENEVRRLNDKERKIAIDSSEVSLSQAEDIYFSELSVMREISLVDEAVWSLMFDDLLDLSTGMNVLLYDENYRPDMKDENVSRAASLLDMDGKTGHIRGHGFPVSRKSLMNFLEKEQKESVKKVAE